MSERLFSHVDVSVPDLPKARPVWDALMRVLGAETVERGAAGVRYVRRGGDGVRTEFVVLQPRFAPVASSIQIAFTAHSPAHVDAVAKAVRAAGAQAIDGPGYHPEIDPTYYAVFFEDACGIALEVCHHNVTS